MCRRIGALAALALALAAGQARAQTLGIGDPAPKIEVRGWVKGQPVGAFQKGKLYVVEFWATWCGPCKVSIPHLTELQKKNPSVTFIGVSVWEKDQAGVKPFVAEMGEKMDYRVAIDLVPNGSEADTGKMAQHWMTAAGQGGIPTAFIVDKESRIAWIGHPMAMEKPLEQIVAGKWDIQTAIAENKRKQAEQQKLGELQGKLQKAGNDPKQLLAVLDQALADSPDLETRLGFLKFQLLRSPAGSPEKAAEYGKRLVQTVLKDEPQALNQLAWMLVAPDARQKAEPVLVSLAVAAAERADEASEKKDAAIADTLARAYFVSGNAKKALETQERAMSLAKGTPLETDQELRGRLEEYRKAVQK